MDLSSEQRDRNKSEALSLLRQKMANKVTNASRIHEDNKASGRPGHAGQMAPPTQSRDATTSSRFAYSKPRSPPSSSILALNSSPVSLSDGNYHGISLSHLAPTSQTNGLSSLRAKWEYTGKGRESDPLAAASLFTRTPQAGPVTRHLHRPPKSDSPGTSMPPSTSASPSDSDAVVPESPSVQLLGKRRRRPAQSSDDESVTFVPQLSNVAGLSRIVRGQRADGMDVALMENPAFKVFRMNFPLLDTPSIVELYQQSLGDLPTANRMNDRGFTRKSNESAKSTPSKTASVLQPPDGDRVAARVKREGEKEKGKQSMIYANRNRLNAVNGSSHQDPIVVLSPSSPAVVPPRQKRRAVQIVGSKSEYEEEQSDNDVELVETRGRTDFEKQALELFNKSNSETLQGLTGCTKSQAEAIIERRPFQDVEDLKIKLVQGFKRKTGPSGLNSNTFSGCVEILENYGIVDDVLERCEKIGQEIQRIVDGWTVKQKPVGGTNAASDEEGGLGWSSLDQISVHGFLRKQPATMSKGVALKEYQLIGLNWLNLLFLKKRSCILADEMGLGKTIQVISFLAHLKEKKSKGPHLIVVPSSTLENWTREFQRFAPSLSCQTYYGSKDERRELRHQLKEQAARSGGWEVLITTYNLAQGDEMDRKFFYKMNWETCIFDEGHVLKNFQSQRYMSLVRIPSKWKLLLTGTPLQNNLEELVSLMNFILPNLFVDVAEELRRVFKSKADSTAAFLSRDRVSRAKRMMTPFVLRRRKDQVLKELPKKTEVVEYCEMSGLQSVIYNEALRRSRTLAATASPEDQAKESGIKDTEKRRKGSKAAAKSKVLLSKDTSSNVLMDLRKAASHPMLFRRRFTDEKLSSIAHVLLRLPDFVRRQAQFELVKEDMEVMTDSELQFLCKQHKATEKFALEPECFEDSGKITVLLKLLDTYKKQRRRVLIFSQFTQILDILQTILQNKSIKFLMLTGSTPVDVRQSLVDEFTEDESIPIFLLSTKAGGMGINLTAASVVIIFDQDYNPHNDKQASDRAYRIGQTRNVDVVKLVTRGTVEEHILRLGRTKLALDEAVAGESSNEKVEEVMKTSLMSTLRQEVIDLEDDALPNAISIDDA